MPGHRIDYQPLTFVVDKWPTPSYAFWMINGVSNDRGFQCTTPNCGFSARTRAIIQKHMKQCSDKTKIIPKYKVYG